MTTPQKPLPKATPDTEPFWQGCKEGKLTLPRCGDCNLLHYYPRAICPHCWSRSLTWEELSGKGTLYSYVISHRPAPGFQEETPYAIAIVELDEGPRMMTNLTGVDQTPESLVLDMPLEITFEDVTEDVTMFKFQPAG